jgi:hypothetical protein
MQAHCLSGPTSNRMIKHLTRGIGVLDLVSRQCLEKDVGVSSEVYGRHQVCRRSKEDTHDACVNEAQSYCASYASKNGPCACHLTSLFLDFAERHDLAVA